MSIKDLFSQPEKFTEHNPLSPAAMAANKWDQREGEIIVQNYNLRKIALGLMFVCMSLAAGLIYQSLQSSIIPYVVEVDSTTGEIRNIGTVASSKNYEPSEAVYKYFLSQFIKNSREIPLDPVVFKSHLSLAHSFLTRDASAKFQAQMKDENLADRFGRETIQVNITSVLPLEGGNSYQVCWDEERFIIGTGDKTIVPYRAILTVQTIETKDEKQLEINPLGVYITDFNWSKDASAINLTQKNNTAVQKSTENNN